MTSARAPRVCRREREATSRARPSVSADPLPNSSTEDGREEGREGGRAGGRDKA